MSDDRASRIRQGRNRNKSREKEKSSSDGASSKNSSSQKSNTGDSTSSSSSYSSGDVRNRKSKNMYLPEAQIKAIDDLFAEAEFRLQKDHNLTVKKNKDFYPAFVHAALEHFDLEAFLEQQQREKQDAE